jgi:hypothetical protein
MVLRLAAKVHRAASSRITSETGIIVRRELNDTTAQPEKLFRRSAEPFRQPRVY